ncbi:hypothetical protein DFH09DRAFT_1277546 [Mycena vulgaris]|nr:hypothetical protein DFH09DRAFT_1277546 [Mycena vulgaris]
MESVSSSQPFEDWDEYCPTYPVKPTVSRKTPPREVGYEGLDAASRFSALPSVTSLRGHLIRRAASPVKTIRSTEPRLDPPVYDADRARRLIRRFTTAPQIKKHCVVFASRWSIPHGFCATPSTASESEACARITSSAEDACPRGEAGSYEANTFQINYEPVEICVV